MVDELARRLAELRDRIDAAAARAGRRGQDVTVVAVTKSAPPAVFARAREAGITDVGENRVPDALRRMAGWERAFRWHFVGPIQANKARRVVGAFDVLHAVDSPALLARIERVSSELDRRPLLLLQVNLSGDPDRHGLHPDGLGQALATTGPDPRSRVVGLMTMAPPVDDPEQARPVFARLAALRERHGGAAALPHLSMGMSGDFEVAVEEGATLVRIGHHLVHGLD